eukprot:1269770-Rhodomonas_salina.1
MVLLGGAAGQAGGGRLPGSDTLCCYARAAICPASVGVLQEEKRQLQAEVYPMLLRNMHYAPA